MPVRTVSDLFNLGFDADVALHIEELRSGQLDIESLANRTLGPEWEGDNETLQSFYETVSEGLDAGRIASDSASQPGEVSPPGVSGVPGTGRYRISGTLSGGSVPSDEGDAGDLEIPFSIDTDIFLTPFELLEILENSEIGSVRSLLDGSPDLRKRLEELEFERIRPEPGDWQPAIIEIIERINEKELS